MSIEDLISSGMIERRDPTKDEIKKLIEYAQRRLDDAGNETVHADARYEQAYNAILACATIGLRALSLRARKRDGHHLISINSFEFTLGIERKTIDYLQRVRRERHRAIYEGGLTVSKTELSEVIAAAESLFQKTTEWLLEKGITPQLFEK